MKVNDGGLNSNLIELKEIPHNIVVSQRMLNLLLLQITCKGRMPRLI